MNDKIPEFVLVKVPKSPCFDTPYSKEVNPKGRCCCNCVWQKPISGHPWNKNRFAKSDVKEIIAYGCTVPEMDSITLTEFKHSLCELHDWQR